MKKTIKLIALSLITVALVAACSDGGQKRTSMIIDNALTQAEIDAGVFTPEVMWKMGRIGSAALSPNGEQVVYTLTYYNITENKGVTSLWLVPQAGGEPVQLTDNAGSDSQPKWSEDGKSIWFMSNRSGDTQLWSVDINSEKLTQISNIPSGINDYGVAESSMNAYYTQDVRASKRESADIHKDLDKSKALIYDDLMVRHWDHWDRGDRSHIFITKIEGSKMGVGKDIMEGEEWDAPLSPYFDGDEITWNNAGTVLAYTCKKLTGTEYALSTDSDIYLYDVVAQATTTFTKDAKGYKLEGYDKYPVFSPDDSMIAFRSMKTPRYEADRERVLVYTIATGEIRNLTNDFDYTASNVIWENNESLLFNAPIEATYQLCRAGIDGNVAVLTKGDHDITAFTLSQGKVVCQLTKLTMATELFNINLADGALTQLTDVNAAIYANIKMPEVEKRWITTTDNKQMLTWVVTPPNFDKNKKYPAILYCQGGPQSVVSQSWSYRWNFMLMSSQGYVVVAPNRRGLPSFGQEWLEQISGDYSGQNVRDYLSAIDEVSKESWVDADKLGCIGASYGGYSVFYLAGTHNKRFKAFISHCGIFNFESMYGSTEELFFINHDYGGSYWSENPVAKRSYANSPHKLVAKWDTPILIYTGMRDYRIPYTQSLEAFTAARLRGIDARFVAFENEAHQVFQPQNSLTWNREFFGWLDKYLK